MARVALAAANQVDLEQRCPGRRSKPAGIGDDEWEVDRDTPTGGERR